MKSSNFEFLEKEFPLLANIGKVAEINLYQDPVISLFKLRQFGEKIVELVFEEHYLEFPEPSNFHNCLIAIRNEQIVPERVMDLLFSIKNKGNVAVHDNKGTVGDAKTILFAAFKVSKWFYETYSTNGVDISELKFHEPEITIPNHALSSLEKEFEELELKFNALLAEREIKQQSIEERHEIIKRSDKAAKKIELSEAETRLIIDADLVKAGWEADTALLNFKTKKTLPEKGRNMAIAEWPCGSKWADYALFIGTELYGFVEAKKYANDISTDLTQAKEYALLVDNKHDVNLLNTWRNYKVPFLFSTNGRPYLEQIKTKSGIWFLDVRLETNRARALHGWISPQGLKDLYSQDIEDAKNRLKDKSIDFLRSSNGLGLRNYQIDAIKAIEYRLTNEPEKNRALLEMATGTGKTRTILGLCYRLISSNRFKRILFLVDRKLLALQTFNTFKDEKIEDLNTFLGTYKVSELKETIPDIESRLHFATVQGMVKRLFYASDDQPVLPIDTYDCIIVDEAHRGYLQDKELDDEELNFKDQRDYVSKYRMVLDYFDAFGVGLTATPALHTTEIFGKAVFTYSYREAVIDGYLIDHDPPYIIKTKLGEEGIKWEKGAKPKVYDKENTEIIELDELEDELKIDISGFNKMVITPEFNRTVIKQLVKEIDPEGDEKTLIFAATDEHADRVVEFLKEEFDQIGIEVSDDAILKITGKSYNPAELVRRFKNEKYPSIGVTVDLLSTGVDVPSICNIVFLRRIKSRILYEQMLGRATRRCDAIGKEAFRIFDAVGVYETLEDFTAMKPVSPNQSTTFVQLVEEIALIDSNERAQKQLEQIIAKFQRKKKYITQENSEIFEYKSKGIGSEDFIQFLKDIPKDNIESELNNYKSVWTFLDELKPEPSFQYFSDHQDEYLRTERGYGNGQKPEDYLEGLKRYIEENTNKITALQIICSRPKDLDRKSLKELKIILDQAGFNTRSLNAAWKDTKNQDMAADIISFIRTLAMGTTLVSHEERIQNAINKVKKLKDWNKIQLKWIDRFEKQLLQEDIIKPEDLDLNPFDEAGGFQRLDKIFENQLQLVLDIMNENLYTA